MMIAEILAQCPPNISEDYVRGIIASQPNATVVDILAIIWDIKTHHPNQTSNDEWRKRNDFMDEVYNEIEKNQKKST